MIRNKKEIESKKKHDHNISTIMYIIGLLIFIIGIFIPNKYSNIKDILNITTIILAGYHVTLEGIKETIEDKVPNAHILMSVAAIGAVLVNNSKEGALLILIFAGAHFLEHFIEEKNEDSIKSLYDLNPTVANLIIGDKTKEVNINQLNIGDKIVVLKGDIIPIDAKVIEGVSTVDQSSINGESMPKLIKEGDQVFGSTINLENKLILEVITTAENTVFSNIMNMVEEASSHPPRVATFISKYEGLYTTLVLAITPLMIFVNTVIFKNVFEDAFYKAMVFLTVASPCALAASAVPATLAAITNSAKNNILFKGGVYMESMAKLDAILFDKTGTLTSGKLEVTDEKIYSLTQKDIDIMLDLESHSTHPIATSLINHFTKENSYDIKNIDNITGFGLHGVYEKDIYYVGKNVEGMKLSQEQKETIDTLQTEGKSIVVLSKNDDILLIIGLFDNMKDDVVDSVNYLKKEGIDTVLLTGDSKKAANHICNRLNMEDCIGEVMPKNKKEVVESWQEKYDTVAMVGDGINDSPALATADIGIAMGDGTDVAMDVADVVVMNGDIENIVYAHKLSKKLDKIIKQNIFIALLTIIVLITLNFFGKMNLPVGVIFHEGSTILVILNGLRMLREIK